VLALESSYTIRKSPGYVIPHMFLCDPSLASGPRKPWNKEKPSEHLTVYSLELGSRSP
jgi:hypothetical protein